MKRKESDKMDMGSFLLGFFIGAYATCLIFAVLLIRKIGFRIAEIKKIMERFKNDSD